MPKLKGTKILGASGLVGLVMRGNNSLTGGVGVGGGGVICVVLGVNVYVLEEVL